MFSRFEQSGVVVVSIKHKRATADIAKEFKDELWNLMDNDQVRRIVVDFSDVIFIDSFFLGALVSSVKKIRLIAGDIRLASLNNSLIPVFKLMHLNDVFQMFETTDQGVASFQF